MSTFALDTHQAIQKLQTKGFSAEQAEGIVSTLTDTDLVTKSDMRETIANLRADIYKAMLVQTGAIVAILAALYAIVG